MTWPDRFRDKNIYVTWYSGGLNKSQQTDVNNERRLYDNIGLNISGFDYKLKTSSRYIGFLLEKKSRKVTFEGFYRTRDYEWTNKKNRNRVWFCEIPDNIIGVKNRGAMHVWSKAILAAEADVDIGAIPHNSIEIGDFFDRYINGDPALVDAV